MASSFRKSIVVQRQGLDGAYVDGRWTTNDPNDGSDSFTIKASVQSPTPRELEAMPEGRRNNDSVVLFTDTQLFTAETSLKKNPDIVIIDNEPYEVLSVAKWRNNIRNHYKIVGVKGVQ